MPPPSRFLAAIIPTQVLWLCACFSHAPQVSGPVPVPTTPGIVYGIVNDKYSNAPIAGARLLVVGRSNEATSTKLGYYTLGPIPPGTYSLQVLFIGYSPFNTVVVISDSSPLRVDVRLTYPGVGPAVDSASWFAIWTTAVMYYHAQEAGHLRQVASITGTGHDSTNGPTAPLVLSLEPELKQSHFAHGLLDSLVAHGLASNACGQAHVTVCPGTGFTTFLTLAVPHQQAGDTVTVSLEETAINVEACRNHRESMGGTHSVILQLVPRGQSWLALGHVGISMSGTIVCGGH